MPHRTRAIWVLVVLACGFTVVSFNLIQIQLVQHAKFLRMAMENHLHSEIIPPKRASILDSEGNVLAQTQQTWDVDIDGALIDSPRTTLFQIAPVLKVPASRLMTYYVAKLAESKVDPETGLSFNTKNRHILLAKNVSHEVVNQLRDLKLAGLIYDEEDQRFYPNKEMAAHVLGYVDDTGHGEAGVEKEMDSALSGSPGERWVERDGKRNEIAGYQPPEKPVVDGSNVTLTINMAIQHVVEDQLDQIVQMYQPVSASIVIMNPETGEIMAMGSRPTFNPNDRRTFKPEGMRNRCLCDMFEPGSIFKMVPLAAALNERLVRLQTPIFCEQGSWEYAGLVLHDDECNGTLPVIEVMAQSSNIGFAKIAVNYLGKEKLYQYATAMGFGQPTGLFDRQSESPGRLRPPGKWTPVSLARIPIGQEMQATPMQMALATSAIANGGKLMAPLLIRKVTDADGRVVRENEPRVVRRPITSETAEEVAKALRQVTIDGTAKKIHIAGYSWAGKTGTAQKFIGNAYSHTKHISSFVGFLPAEDPAFVAVVMVDEPHTTKDYGAEVSAPVFAAIAKQAAQILNIPEDEPVMDHPILSSNNSVLP